EGRRQTTRWAAHAGSRLKLPDVAGRSRLKSQPLSRTGENPPYGISGGAMETSASFEARSAPSSYPTRRIAVERGPTGVIVGDNVDYEIARQGRLEFCIAKCTHKLTRQRGVVVHHDCAVRATGRCRLDEHSGSALQVGPSSRISCRCARLRCGNCPSNRTRGKRSSREREIETNG